MNPPALPRRALLGGAAALSACAGTGPVAPDRQALAAVKRIAVPAPGAPAQPVVEVVTGVSGDLGLLGRVAGTAARERRVAELAGLLAAQGFDVGAALRTALADRLRGRGFAPILQPAGGDAALQATILRYGFSAQSESSSDPFRPTITVAVGLTRATDGATLFRDEITIGSEAITFPTFVRIEDDPARAAASLREVAAAAAGAVVDRLGPG